LSARADAFAVDASVALKLFLSEADSDRAEALFARLGEERPPTVHAPDLLFAECANVFRTRVMRRLLTASAAASALGALRELPLAMTSIHQIVEAALDVAIDREISVYDACYAAVALRFGVPLISADERLVAKLKGSSVDARTLSSVVPRG
jgi:predicted nucleic acid-binding protein